MEIINKIPLDVKIEVCKRVNMVAHDMLSVSAAVKKMVKSRDREDLLLVIEHLRLSRDHHNHMIDYIYSKLN